LTPVLGAWGVLRGCSGDAPGEGAGRGAVLSSLASDQNLSRVSETTKNNTFCCDFYPPPEWQSPCQSLENPIHLCRHPQKSVSKSKVTPVMWYSPSAPLEVGSSCTTGSYPMSRPLFASQIPYSCDVAFEFQCHKRRGWGRV
jgi:hypothetical protein